MAKHQDSVTGIPEFAGSQPVSVEIVASTDAALPAAEALAHRLNLPLGKYSTPPTGMRLIQSEKDLSLHDPTSGARLRVEFTEALLRRFRQGRDPLRRAIGKTPRDVIDATAGLGGDTVHLVALGYRVTAIERHPIVSALTQDGLSRACAHGLLEADNPRWLVGDARTVVPELVPRAATIYLDPMFPLKRKKSAAVRKEMNLLRQLGIDESGASELVAIARKLVIDRVVVKRPIDAPPLLEDVMATYAGKLVRYDAYQRTGTET